MKVVLCYRRDDSSQYIDQIVKNIDSRFGRGTAFCDISNIPLGANFVDFLRNEIKSASVVLVLIGPSWISNTNAMRLQDTNDFVRLDIAAALQFNVPIIPILLDGATMPSSSELPDELSELSRRNAFEVRTKSLSADLKNLNTVLKHTFTSDTNSKQNLKSVSSENELKMWREIRKSNDLEATVQFLDMVAGAPLEHIVRKHLNKVRAKQSAFEIFINYRREDSEYATDRIYERLCTICDSKRIFLDVHSIPKGREFPDYLLHNIKYSKVFLSVMGRNWLAKDGENSASRLLDPSDYVRTEIEAALKEGVLVVPLVLNGAQLPQPEELPESLRPLVRRNAAFIKRESFHSDIAHLVDNIPVKKKFGIRF